MHDRVITKFSIDSKRTHSVGLLDNKLQLCHCSKWQWCKNLQVHVLGQNFLHFSLAQLWLFPDCLLLSASFSKGNWEATAQHFLSGELCFAAYSQNLQAISQQSWASYYLGSLGNPYGVFQLFWTLNRNGNVIALAGEVIEKN